MGQVEYHKKEGFQVISPRLLEPLTCSQTAVARGSDHALASSHADMLARGGHILLGEAEVNDEYSFFVLAHSYCHVAGFDVTVEEPHGVDEF